MSLHVLFSAVVLCSPLWAIPPFVLLTGNRCAVCHLSPGGSGPRSELGWYSMHDVGLLQWRHLGLEALERWWQHQGNTFWSGRLVVGIDGRLQGFQSHNPAYAQRWRMFPMQAALHLGIQPVKALSAAFSVNGGRRTFPGQQLWSGSLLVHPAEGWPFLQLGFLPPLVGMHYDDHTILARRLPGARFDSPQTTYLLAPNAALWGALLHWARLPWLALSAGAFQAGGLSELYIPATREGQRPLTGRTQLVWNGHLWLTPRNASWSLSSGTSWLGNREFALWQLFGGLGWIDHAYAWAEYSSFQAGSLRRWTVSVEGGLWLWDALMPYVRLEHGRVRMPSDGDTPYTTQLVVGTQLFVLPFVELRPEYRWVDTEGYRSGRPALQVHVFY